MVCRYRSHRGMCGSGTNPVEPWPDMREMLWDMLRQIPPGKVTTYGALAEALGDVRAARAIGSLLASNPTPPDPPCHRVVYSDGRVGWYKGRGRGAEEKEALLMSEGVHVEGGRVDLSEHLHRLFSTQPVLQDMRDMQECLASSLVTEGGGLPGIVSALDVSYRGDDAFAARVDFSYPAGEELGSQLHRCKAVMPYIPGYLGFREAPILEPLMVDDGRVHLIDGNGALHPRGAGIACQLGIPSRRTVGVAKSLLLGELKDSSVMVEGDEKGRKVGRYYVSVGNLISLDAAEGLLSDLLEAGIDPCRRAHELATRFRKSV